MNSSRLHSKLNAWYDAERRKLPWRENASPYRTWISEVMLQQTSVATVVPYFERFLKRFPDAASLAASREQEVLKLWAGLGYYSRARNLRRAARTIMAEHGGEVPRTLESLRSLAGIGRYSAAAIASIAYGRPHELVDGNVARVYARLFGVRGDVKAPAAQKRLWALAAVNLDRERPGTWNQALMELGARVCLPPPETPACALCPLRGHCRAFRSGLQNRLPESSRRPEPISLAWTALRISRGGRLLLWRRGSGERFLPGHWGLPEPRHLAPVRAGPALRTIRHSITHHRIALTVRDADLVSERLPPQARWVPERRLEEYLVSSLWRKALRGADNSRENHRRRRVPQRDLLV